MQLTFFSDGNEAKFCLSCLCNRLETSLYMFNAASDGGMMAFLKTHRDLESIVWYCTYIDW